MSRKAFVLSMYVYEHPFKSVSDCCAVNELRIVVNPNEIRLKPRPDDPYRWRLSPSKQSLFKNQLSKQGTRGCKEIFRSVGETITAVSASVVGDRSEMGALEINQTVGIAVCTRIVLTTCRIRPKFRQYANPGTTMETDSIVRKSH